jgi:hypothetical protein
MVLTENHITDGKKLVQHLDASSHKVDAAFWFLFPDTWKWKLVLSLPEMEKSGPKALYKAVQKALDSTKIESAISLDEVTILKPTDSLLKLMRSAIRTGPGLSSIRFANNVINGTKIEDALIYRL